MNGWPLTLLVTIAMFVVMVGFWLWQARTGMSSVVDIGWAFSIKILGVACCIFAEGIPSTEKQAVKSRGEAYRNYKKTPAFVPWFSNNLTAKA